MDLIKDFFLEANPNPERKGCPDEQTLKALAEDRLPPDDPWRVHLASCSECFAEYDGYRSEWEEARSQRPLLKKTARLHTHSRILTWAVAAALIVSACGGYLAYRHQQSENLGVGQRTTLVPVNASVDLFSAATLRGADDDAAPLQQVSLPAVLVHLSVTLPRFSHIGRYDVLVTKDRAGSEVVAMGAGLAVEHAGKIVVDVTLDLRGAKAGAYFLGTVRGADNGTYYYPLTVSRSFP